MSMSTAEKVVAILLALIVLFGLLYAALPGIKTSVNNIFQALGGLVGMEFETLPGGDIGGSSGGGACSVDVSDCQLAVMHSPSLTAADVRTVLTNANSPAIREEPDIADWFYQESVRTGVDDAFALAFFKHESSYGKTGEVPTTKSIGNIRYTQLCTDKYGGTNHEGFCKYPTWKASVTHWYNLIKDGYVDQGYDTLGEIIARYAPCSENNINDYIADVTSFVKSYGVDISTCQV